MKTCSVRLHLDPAYEPLRSFVRQLPETFDRRGETLFAGRNTIRAFDIGGLRVAVKRFKRPGPFQAFVYSRIRKSKARRAYEHALRLRASGIDTPAPVAWCECRRRGVLTDSYLITLRSDLAPFSEAAARFPSPDTRPVLDAFARFTVRLHEAGVEHEDFNHGNILHRRNDEGGLHFQLIDINRMRFHPGPLSMRRCMINLRRLSCPAPAFLYLLDRYAELRGWDLDDTLLRGILFRLLFVRRKQMKRRFRRRSGSSGAKNSPGNLD